MIQYLHLEHPFRLECGAVLPRVTITYHRYGRLNAARDNVVWVCHALTANSDPVDWWAGLVGPGDTIDTERYCVICANMLGSCYGTTGPAALNPATGQRYGMDFPTVTVRDMARLHGVLADMLELRRIRLVIGGSMGGQQALEWATLDPVRIEQLCVLATNARHSAWGIAFNESQRMALRADPTFGTDDTEAGRAGLEAARAIAILSYRHYRTYQATQTEPDAAVFESFRASSYQRYQGFKLWKRFDPEAYWALSRAMDSHNLARGHASMEAALGRIQAESLIISIDTDVLFPLEEQQLLARHIPRSQLEVITSDYGHDGFLTETHTVSELLKTFLRERSAVPSARRREVLPGQSFALPGTEPV
jgi:homoserine O-acetyltransferase